MRTERHIKVKICGLREPENVAAVCRSGPDFVGFVFARASKRYAGDRFDRATFDLAGETVERVAVFLDEPLDDVRRLIDCYPFEGVQLHGDEDPEYCAILRKAFPSLLIIKAFNVDREFKFSRTEAYRASCDHFLFDSGSRGRGGSGEAFDWSRLVEYDNAKSFFLAGGLDEGCIVGVPALLEAGCNLCALDFNSRLEVSPGVKDEERVRRVIQEVRKWEIQ